MQMTRRSLLGAAGGAAIGHRSAHAQTRKIIRIGVINDQSGPYRDVNGPTSIACTRQAIQEFGAGSFDVEVLSADHQNKPDVGTAITRQWIDQQGVDFIQDGASSAVALAISSICRERNKVFVPTSTATSDLTGKACSPNTIHWVYDTYMEAKSTGGAMVKTGGDTWYFITPNYAAGLAFQRDTTNFVEAAGGKILGSHQYPFPETSDFSAPLVEAKASGAKILGIAGAGSDLINIVKQAHEFGVQKTMNLAALIAYSTDVHSIGLETAQGLRLSETYYWDLNNRTRSFQNRDQRQSLAVAEHVAGGQLLLHAALLESCADHGPRSIQGRRCGDSRTHEGNGDGRRLLRHGPHPRGRAKGPPGVFVRGEEAVGQPARVGFVQADRQYVRRGGLAAAVGACLPAGQSVGGNP